MAFVVPASCGAQARAGRVAFETSSSTSHAHVARALRQPASLRRAAFLGSRVAPRSPRFNAGVSFCGPVASVEQLQKVLEEQKALPRLSPAETVRGLIKKGRYCTLSTNSSKHEGFPSGAVIQMAEVDGTPIFSLSSISIHTQDLLKDPRCSITVAPGFAGMSDPRVVLLGKVEKAAESETEKLKEAFLKVHPDSFWVEFGDFSFFKFTEIKAVNFNGGFGAAVNFGSDEYFAASPDPLIDFAAPVMRHMNDDHEEDLKLYAKHYLSLDVDGAKMSNVDQYGFDMAVQVGEMKATVRLPFKERVDNRKAIKEALVSLHQDAMASKGESK
eukprot:tig00000350_g24314.t1